jgi:hypothetical protein
MSFFDALTQPVRSGQIDVADAVLFALVIAFIVGQLNAWCYKWTHRGVSYSRSFTQSLVLITMVTSVSMSLVAVHPIAAIGLLGGISIIRFRTVVRDARDSAYVLLCLVCGMAAGFGYAAVAVLCSASANLVAYYLYRTGFGAWRAMDSMLRFEVVASGLSAGAIDPVLRKYCRRHAVVSVDESPVPARDGGRLFQCVYRVRLRDRDRSADMLSELRRSSPIEAVHLLVEQENEEVA